MAEDLKPPKRNWIFLRGLARSSSHWGSFIEKFKQAFPDDEIELMDLRGNGSLAFSPSWISVEDNVRDLRSRSKFVSDGRQIHLMSISLGAMVATEWSRKFPEEIEGVILINTSDRGTASFFHRMRLRNVRHFLQILKNPENNLASEKQILEMTTSMPGMEQWADIFSKLTPTSRSNFIRQLAAAARYRFPDHKPKTEVLILCGAKDKLVNPICSERIAKMWTLTAHCHPQGGHDLPLEAGAWVLDQTKAWLREME